MTAPRTFNVYCDASCHMEHDHIPVMARARCMPTRVACHREAVRALTIPSRSREPAQGHEHETEIGPPRWAERGRNQWDGWLRSPPRG
jgi:hypothetical protein